MAEELLHSLGGEIGSPDRALCCVKEAEKSESNRPSCAGLMGFWAAGVGGRLGSW